MTCGWVFRTVALRLTLVRRQCALTLHSSCIGSLQIPPNLVGVMPAHHQAGGLCQAATWGTVILSTVAIVVAAVANVEVLLEVATKAALLNLEV